MAFYDNLQIVMEPPETEYILLKNYMFTTLISIFSHKTEMEFTCKSVTAADKKLRK